MSDHGTTFIGRLAQSALVFMAAVLLCVAAVAQDQNGNDDEAKEIFELLNHARVQDGLPPLAWDDHLAAAALTHAQLMAERRAVVHDLPGEADLLHRVAVTGLHFDVSGENVAFNADPEAVHAAFMKSKEHRENILDRRYNAVGIAVVAKDNGIYVVQDFANRIPQISTEEFKQDVVAKVADLRKRSVGGRWMYLTRPELDKRACDMARRNRLDSEEVLSATGGLFAAVYTAMAPGELPNSVLQAKNESEARSYSVGVCYTHTAKYPAGAYWVVVVFFGAKPMR